MLRGGTFWLHDKGGPCSAIRHAVGFHSLRWLAALLHGYFMEFTAWKGIALNAIGTHTFLGLLHTNRYGRGRVALGRLIARFMDNLGVGCQENGLRLCGAFTSLRRHFSCSSA